MNEMTEGHTVHSYNDELEHLHQAVIEAGNLAVEQIIAAIKSLEDEDPEAAGYVIQRDREIDALELALDEQIVRVVARRQPMARDLREILAVGKIMSDLERIGDQARRLARLTLHFYDGDSDHPANGLLNDIPKLAAVVQQMVCEAVEAFGDLDQRKALRVIEQDNALDDEVKAALRRLSTYLLEDARSVGHVVDITLGLRAIERIGSHAAYIARHTIFLIKGKDVRHESVDEVARDVAG